MVNGVKDPKMTKYLYYIYRWAIMGLKYIEIKK